MHIPRDSHTRLSKSQFDHAILKLIPFSGSDNLYNGPNSTYSRQGPSLSSPIHPFQLHLVFACINHIPYKPTFSQIFNKYIRNPLNAEYTILFGISTQFFI